MTRFGVKTLLTLAWAGAMTGFGWAQSAGPSATPATLSFSYLVNSSTQPASQKVTVSLPTSLSSLTLKAATSAAWVTATPSTGKSPLALTVSVNPSGMGPGNYQATITITTIPTATTSATVTVTLLISNPPSTLVVSSAAFPSNAASLGFTYTTGNPATNPASATINVASTGDVIPFSVTAATGSGSGTSKNGSAVWLRVGQNNQTSVTTSGVALSGSSVPIDITIDKPTIDLLDPGNYSGTVTVAASNPANGTVTVTVTLVISAGLPKVDAIFPDTLVAAPVVDPVLTIFGDNFFPTSVPSIQFGNSPPIALSSPKLLSRQILQATVNASYLTFPLGTTYPIAGTVYVTNPPPADNPSQPPASIAISVLDPSAPEITSVVNAASFMETAVFTGNGANPAAGGKSVSPREIVSIFGRNLGPADVTPGVPSGTPIAYPLSVSNVEVTFTFGTPAQTVKAPIIMVSSNQINCIAPVELATALGGSVRVQVNVNGVKTSLFGPLNIIASDPGVFTFGGLGQGQAAVLNFESGTGSYTINSSKNAAARSTAIVIYATGLGDLAATTPAIINGEVTSSVAKIAAQTCRVEIDGQSAAVLYAGTSPGAVAGLVQINAVIPQNLPRTGASIPLTVSVGDPASSRRSQAGVTIAVK